MAEEVQEKNSNDTVVDEEEIERRHFHRIINAYRFYRHHALKRVYVAEKHYKNLSKEHQSLIPNLPSHFKKLRVCIDHNYQIIKLILQNVEDMFENRENETLGVPGPQPATEFDMDKVKTTIKQFVRDWSADGKHEREACYKPVLDEIEELFPPDRCDPAEISVLVPGAGLGRLAFEIARRGYTCQGNEFSLFMLFASNFVLNKCGNGTDIYTLYPWVHQHCNNRSNEDQTRPITFPDVNPWELSEQNNSNFSMAAGDFLEVYTEPDSWDCISTVFFIDTAHNVVKYIETIWNILKPGGYWINLGPLLYHFADMPTEMSIELSWADLRDTILKFGFQMLKEKEHVPATYIQNPRSMLQYHYDCVFFVVRKPPTSINQVHVQHTSR